MSNFNKVWQNSEHYQGRFFDVGGELAKDHKIYDKKRLTEMPVPEQDQRS